MKKKDKPESREERDARHKRIAERQNNPDPLILEIQRVWQMAGKNERWKTYHALKEALRVAGWELAGIIEKREGSDG